VYATERVAVSWVAVWFARESLTKLSWQALTSIPGVAHCVAASLLSTVDSPAAAEPVAPGG